nr:hypothetical protein [Tanacetum cinerariifolium]
MMVKVAFGSYSKVVFDDGDGYGDVMVTFEHESAIKVIYKPPVCRHPLNTSQPSPINNQSANTYKPPVRHHLRWESNFDDDETRYVPGSLVESSRIKKANKFDFITKDVKHIHLTKEQINQQKEIKEEAKAKAARRKGKIKKKELIDLLGPDVVNKYYNDKLQYDKYYDKMLNRRAKSRITNCDILTRKGLITLKVYRDDDTNEIIPEFKASDLHLGPRLDDHPRTFSSFLVAEVDKRNLNPLKQIRIIEKLRFARHEKDMLYVKRSKADLLGKVTSKV